MGRHYCADGERRQLIDVLRRHADFTADEILRAARMTH